jgi:hypothetical protein
VAAAADASQKAANPACSYGTYGTPQTAQHGLFHDTCHKQCSSSYEQGVLLQGGTVQLLLLLLLLVSCSKLWCHLTCSVHAQRQ